jgi:nucleotide-binding universal stress UspA family protein
MACEHSPVLYYEAGVLDFDPIEEDRKLIKKRMAEQERRFRKATELPGRTIEWRCSIDRLTDFLVQEARAADLILVPAHDNRSSTGLEPGRLVLAAGRPVLFMHPSGLQVPLEILIGWKDSREARRAVLDALPLFTIAKHVHVLEVLEGENTNDVEADKRLKDVVSYLAAHGVSATSAHASCDGGAGDDLVQAALASGANLIIAGGYGHSRLGEWFFGGVTRSLLMQESCSVFLSH